MAILMGSYLYMVQEQRQSVARSQTWNQALVVAEAGVDEALAQLNSGISDGNFATSPWWKNAGGGYFTNRISPMQFKDCYYAVSIFAPSGSTNPVITSIGYVPAPISKTWLFRKVSVQTKTRPTFPVKAPMIVKQSFNSNGNNVNTDSFDSTLGPYNPATAGNNGDVVSLSTNASSVTVGNGKINGTVHTPLGGTYGTTSDKTATIGANGKVGDTAWVNGSTPGFETGHFKDDFTLSDFPDATLPNPPAWYTPIGGTDPQGYTYTYALGSLGSYQVVGDFNSGSVYVQYPNTVLYVTGNLSISGTKQGNKTSPAIHIAPGASLTIYVGGASTTIAGNGVVNDSKLASNFQYYGLPNNTSISITGNGAFYGTIYAPQAAFTLKGSGNNSTDDFTGASITKTTTMTGNFNFHYDTSLSMLTTLGGYDVTSWTEL